MRRNFKAFTLTEVLLVSALFAVIGLAVFNAFSNGFKLWARGEKLIVEADISILLDKMGEDIRGLQNISTIPLKGMGQSFLFPTLIQDSLDRRSLRAKEEWGVQLGAVEYYFDSAQKQVYRRQANYGKALKKQWFEPRMIAGGVENLTFQYYLRTDKVLQTKNYIDTVIPAGVEVEIVYFVQGEQRTMRRFLGVPTGGGL